MGVVRERKSFLLILYPPINSIIYGGNVFSLKFKWAYQPSTLQMGSLRTVSMRSVVKKQQFVAFMLLVILSMIGRMKGTRNG